MPPALSQSKDSNLLSLWDVYVCFLLWKIPEVFKNAPGRSSERKVILGKLIVPWRILEFNKEKQLFGDFFSFIKAGHFSVIEVSDDLKRAKLLKTYVGNKPDSLIVSGSDQCVIAVCSQLAVYVKFSVELPKEETDVLVSRPNAFSIMIAA